MDNIYEKLLDSGGYFYFKSDYVIYSIAKVGGEYKLHCWNDEWIEYNIDREAMLELMEQNSLTRSLQQVHWWILGLYE